MQFPASTSKLYCNSAQIHCFNFFLLCTFVKQLAFKSNAPNSSFHQEHQISMYNEWFQQFQIAFA